MQFLIFLVSTYLLLLPLPARADENASQEAEPPKILRLRFTETSLTETGDLSDCDFKVQTRGFGFTAISPIGIGVSYTMLTTSGDGASTLGPTEAALRHNYLDLSYTIGSQFLATVGVGTLTGGDYSLAATQSLEGSEAKGSSLFIGPGFSLGWFEAY